MRLFLLLVAVPIIEIALFIEIGGWIGTWPTIGIVILTALIGSVLLRQQGMAALRDVQGRIASGENPGRLLAEGAMILVAGVLLLTPGFFTDAFGFALLIPPVRGVIFNFLAARITVHQVNAGGAQAHPSGEHTVDGVYEDITPDNPDPSDHTDRPGPLDRP